MNPNKQKWIAKTYFYMITTYFKFIQLMVTMYIRVFEKSVQSHPGWRYITKYGWKAKTRGNFSLLKKNI